MLLSLIGRSCYGDSMQQIVWTPCMMKRLVNLHRHARRDSRRFMRFDGERITTDEAKRMIAALESRGLRPCSCH